MWCCCGVHYICAVVHERRETFYFKFYLTNLHKIFVGWTSFQVPAIWQMCLRCADEMSCFACVVNQIFHISPPHPPLYRSTSYCLYVFVWALNRLADALMQSHARNSHIIRPSLVIYCFTVFRFSAFVCETVAKCI